VDFPPFLAAISPDHGVFPPDPAIYLKLHTISLKSSSDLARAKPRKPKEKPDDMNNAEWERDVHRRRDPRPEGSAEAQAQAGRRGGGDGGRSGDSNGHERRVGQGVDRPPADLRRPVSSRVEFGLGLAAGLSPSFPAMFQ
jgi:hypothetical protein